MLSDRNLHHREEIAYKIIIIGDTDVGKTSIFHNFISGSPLTQTELITTIDLRYKTISLHDKKIKLCVWDTAGQEKFRSLISSYFNGAHGVLMVFDLSSPSSFMSIKKQWYEFAQKRSEHAIKLLIGNKSDLQPALSQKEIYQWCKLKSVYYIETSALTGKNIKECFFTLASMIDATKTYQLTEEINYRTISMDKIVIEDIQETQQTINQRGQIVMKRFSSAKTICQSFIANSPPNERFSLKQVDYVSCPRYRC